MPSYKLVSTLFLFSLVSASTAADFTHVKRSGEDGLDRRQTGTQPVVVLGKSNPPINVAQVNPIGDTTPLIGTAGQLADFVKGGAKRDKRQTGDTPVVVMGKANPAINAADVNGLGDTTPLTGTGGALADFSVPNAANDRRSLDVNMISHAIATRGLAGGVIEVIEARSLVDDEDDDE